MNESRVTGANHLLPDGIRRGIIMPQEGGESMPQCIPIRDLKNTAEISQMCQRAKEPITITKNGYDDMVIMSAKMYDKLRLYSVYEKRLEAEDDITDGKVSDAHASLQKLRTQYGL